MSLYVSATRPRACPSFSSPLVWLSRNWPSWAGRPPSASRTGFASCVAFCRRARLG